MRKRLLAQGRAQEKLGPAAMSEDFDTELKARLDVRIKELEQRISAAITADDRLAETADILRSVPGIGAVATAMLIAEMPELGAITGEQGAALAGLAPVAHDSGTLRGKRAIAGGRRSKAGKAHKVIITAVARKLITLANALCKSHQKWAVAAA